MRGRTSVESAELPPAPEHVSPLALEDYEPAGLRIAEVHEVHRPKSPREGQERLQRIAHLFLLVPSDNRRSIAIAICCM